MPLQIQPHHLKELQLPRRRALRNPVGAPTEQPTELEKEKERVKQPKVPSRILPRSVNAPRRQLHRPPKSSHCHPSHPSQPDSPPSSPPSGPSMRQRRPTPRLGTRSRNSNRMAIRPTRRRPALRRATHRRATLRLGNPPVKPARVENDPDPKLLHRGIGIDPPRLAATNAMMIGVPNVRIADATIRRAANRVHGTSNDTMVEIGTVPIPLRMRAADLGVQDRTIPGKHLLSVRQLRRGVSAGAGVPVGRAGTTSSARSHARLRQTHVHLRLRTRADGADLLSRHDRRPGAATRTTPTARGERRWSVRW